MWCTPDATAGGNASRFSTRTRVQTISSGTIRAAAVHLRLAGLALAASMSKRSEPPTRYAIGAMLADEYGLQVSSVDVITEGNEGFKFVAQVGPSGYFVKVVPVSESRALRFSAGATAELSRRGCPWVVPPLATLAGCFIANFDDSVVEVRPFVVGTPEDDPFPSDDSLEDLGQMLGELHAAGRALALNDPLDDHKGSMTSEMDDVIESAGRIGGQDSRGAIASTVLDNRVTLREAATMVDTLRSHVDDARDRWVVTHGDSPGNVVVDPGGQKYLIDWSVACLTPPERDVVPYATARFEQFLAGYQREGSVEQFSLGVIMYYLHRWQVEGVTYFGKRLFDGDPRGDYNAQNESVLRLYVPYRSDAVAESLAIVKRALYLSR